jgi:FlaA1/EpsC-like NDP-sugar epimerase
MTHPVKILIAGAGLGGVHAVRELREAQPDSVEILGFVDDSESLRNTTVEGIHVLGSTEDIPNLSSKLDIDEVIIAMPSVGGSTIRRIQRICSSANVVCKVIPGAHDILTGLAAPQALREVRFEDLIKREPAVIDLESIRSYLEQEVILVTGAGGSIGSELARQVSILNPKKLILLDRAENSLTELLWDLRLTGKDKITEVVIADLADERKLKRIFLQNKPNVVFHAAAFKHVYLMELYPEEAIRNNIIGSNILFKTSIDSEVERVIAISTDKAVNATSIMGASKRVMELLVKEYARRQDSTRFSAVRFGNVFNSDGSVVRLFKKQIDNDGPITITDPEVERYFMSVSEASQLVMQVGSFSDNGSIYVLDMDEPLKIMDVAREMCLLRGHQLGETIEVQITGLTSGEKMSEQLATEMENIEKTVNERVFRIVDDSTQWVDMEEALHRLEDLADDCNKAKILTELRMLVPEFGRK